MSADRIIYCLEHLTDYTQFERFCSDLMHSLGYVDIEPLGGSSDRGRDALFRSASGDNHSTVFAYSVRSDWAAKLRQDCRRIKEEGHEVGSVVFVSTSTFSATERDKATTDVQDDFGWQLELFGLERIRLHLVGEASYLIAQHPGIFSPPFFPTSGGLSIAESHDTIVLDHVPHDHALATWLARRLQLQGYRTWCFGAAPLAGENADNSVRVLIEKRAARYLPVFSESAIRDADLLGRCGLASGKPELTLPCQAGLYDDSNLPSRIREKKPCRFDERWSIGLEEVLSALDLSGLKPSLDSTRGQAIALRSFAPVSVTKDSPESVYANSFCIDIPDKIQVSTPHKKLSKKEGDELRKVWPFVRISNNRMLSFTAPPTSLKLQPWTLPESIKWRSRSRIDGVETERLIQSLIYRCLDAAYISAGLSYCEHRNKYYFDSGDSPHYKVDYVHVDGRSTYAALTGEISWGSAERRRPFRYQVCPNFSVFRDEPGEWWLGGRLYIRVTDRSGKPFEEKEIGRRRKKVVKSWWNKKWFAVTLAMMKGLSQGEDEIVIGHGDQAVRIGTLPLAWDCPVAIDHKVLSVVGDFQDEMAQLSFREEVSDEDED